MELRHLRYFVAVAEELSFTRAAERLHIGQPPLSQQIQALEAEVGARLFDRSKRWVRLTEAGKLFLEDARAILAQSERAAERARRAQRGEAGELRVGFTFSTPFTPLFARTIRRYRQLYPDVALTLHEMTTLHQIDALEARKIDLGFVRPPEVALPEHLALTTLRRDALLLVLSSDSPLARKRKIKVADLAELPWVMYPKESGVGINHAILSMCRAAGFVPQVAMEAGEAATIIGLVAAGIGVSVLPSPFQSMHLEGVVFRPLDDTGAVTSLQLAQRRGDGGALVEAFVRVALEENR
ncbi:LysR family transcriptional regulator [Duganella sp. Root1480D1]|uniref:LysR family transcriptional regulator n=1 Tax=Duganella sp. Root1480D1 TaxID=1736471 RepID=UPI00070C2DC5|nr:LysR family transcriptional regulator [Duganella sp. Root1480D1]KQZ39560.1 LysR family transcriptional regulator [Duganella sp. Root1480D1]